MEDPRYHHPYPDPDNNTFIKRYWVNGSGDWGDINHWSDSSGGTGGFAPPLIRQDITIIDSNSFTALGGTITGPYSQYLITIGSYRRQSLDIDVHLDGSFVITIPPTPNYDEIVHLRFVSDYTDDSGKLWEPSGDCYIRAQSYYNPSLTLESPTLGWSSRIVTPHDDSFIVDLGDFTWAAWLRVDPRTNAWGTDTWLWGSYTNKAIDSDEFRVQFFSSQLNFYGFLGSPFGLSVPFDGKRHHVAFVRTSPGVANATDYLVFCDGVLQNRGSASSIASINSKGYQDYLSIGKSYNGSAFHGYLEEVLFQNGARWKSNFNPRSQMPCPSADRYWVNSEEDPCNFNDSKNWSEETGGEGGATIPEAGDHAIFDNNSCVNRGDYNTIYIYDLAVECMIDTIQATDYLFSIKIWMDGSLSLQNDISNIKKLSVEGAMGKLLTNNFNIEGETFFINTQGEVDLKLSEIAMTDSIYINGYTGTLSFVDSTLILNKREGNVFVPPVIWGSGTIQQIDDDEYGGGPVIGPIGFDSVSDFLCTSNIPLGNIQINFSTPANTKLQLADQTTIAKLTINGDGHVELYSNRLTVTGDIIFIGNTLGGLWLTGRGSSSLWNAWKLIKESGVVTASNCSLQNSRASGGASFIADESSVNKGGNSGWIFNAPISAEMDFTLEGIHSEFEFIQDEGIINMGVLFLISKYSFENVPITFQIGLQVIKDIKILFEFEKFDVYNYEYIPVTFQINDGLAYEDVPILFNVMKESTAFTCYVMEKLHCTTTCSDPYYGTDLANWNVSPNKTWYVSVVGYVVTLFETLSDMLSNINAFASGTADSTTLEVVLSVIDEYDTLDLYYQDVSYHLSLTKYVGTTPLYFVVKPLTDLDEIRDPIYSNSNIVLSRGEAELNLHTYTVLGKELVLGTHLPELEPGDIIGYNSIIRNSNKLSQSLSFTIDGSQGDDGTASLTNTIQIADYKELSR